MRRSQSLLQNQGNRFGGDSPAAPELYRLDSSLPNIQSAEYKRDAVTSGFRLLEKHGGFFLADVVGLGKTMIATLIAKSREEELIAKIAKRQPTDPTIEICSPPDFEDGFT